ncbi:hypothetical protein M0Q97_08655 [Candidatus Dojkabacteria bacterium]|jgi:hypothetical protein|nr:hypothetical protein [Candidatus Dojkabacteria bacterium]
MFNLTYAKKCGIPKFAEFKTKNEVIEFLIENLEDIDLLTINNSIIDIKLLIKNFNSVKNQKILNLLDLIKNKNKTK